MSDVYSVTPDRDAFPWMEDAACHGSRVHYPEGRDSERAKQVRLAKEICATCPLATQWACHAYAEANDERWGVWAGVNRQRSSNGEALPKGASASRRASFVAALPIIKAQARLAHREAWAEIAGVS